MAVSLVGTACTDGTDPDPPAIEVSNRRWLVTPSAGATLTQADLMPMAQALARTVMAALFTPWVYETLDATSKSVNKGLNLTSPCTLVGTQRVAWNDNDHDGRMSAGDTLSVQMQACLSAQDPRTVDGAWSMQITRVLLDAQQHVAALEATGQLGPLTFGGVSIHAAAYQLHVTDDWGSTQRSRMALRSCTLASGATGSPSVLDMDVYTVHTLLQREHHLSGRLTTGTTAWCLASDLEAPLVMASSGTLPGSFNQQTADVMPSSGRMQLTDAVGGRLILHAKGPLVDVFFYAAGSSQPAAQSLNLTWDALLNGTGGAPA